MLKKRLVACIVVRGGIAVQSIGFKKYLPIGSAVIAAEFLNKWGIDEIILVDIDNIARKKGVDFSMITEISKKIFVPLTVAGGIRNLEDIRKIVRCGADKISINKLALTNPKIIKEASEIFGSQCIAVSIDAKLNKNGVYKVFSDSGATETDFGAAQWAKQAESLGAGEIFLNSIDRDGSKKGYDLDLVRTISSAVNIPVIAAGGAGHPRHFLEGILDGNASAVAAGNFFHFTEHSPIIVKSYLRRHNIDIRLETYADYDDIDFDEESGRITKKPDSFLEKLRFEYMSEEII